MHVYDDDSVFKALADPTRRRILDLLRNGPRTTGYLVEQITDLSRCGVMKHLEILVEAELVLIRREGRHRWNHLNPIPIRGIHERWISDYVGLRAASLLRLKKQVTGRKKPTGSTS